MKWKRYGAQRPGMGSLWTIGIPREQCNRAVLQQRPSEVNWSLGFSSLFTESLPNPSINRKDEQSPKETESLSLQPKPSDFNRWPLTANSLHAQMSWVNSQPFALRRLITQAYPPEHHWVNRQTKPSALYLFSPPHEFKPLGEAFRRLC